MEKIVEVILIDDGKEIIKNLDVRNIAEGESDKDSIKWGFSEYVVPDSNGSHFQFQCK